MNADKRVEEYGINTRHLTEKAYIINGPENTGLGEQKVRLLEGERWIK